MMFNLNLGSSERRLLQISCDLLYLLCNIHLVQFFFFFFVLQLVTFKGSSLKNACVSVCRVDSSVSFSGPVQGFRVCSHEERIFGFKFQKLSQVSNSNADGDLSLVCVCHPSLPPPCVEHTSVLIRTSRGRESQKEKEGRMQPISPASDRQPSMLRTVEFMGRGKLSGQVRCLDCMWVLFVGFPTKYN